MTNIVGDCKVCGKFTDVIFNIDFKQSLICELCARSITLQQVIWWNKQPISDQTEELPK